MDKRKEFLKISYLSPQDVIQLFTSILWMQDSGKVIPQDEVQSLTGNIERLGGLNAIEDWLKANDATHKLPSTFKVMDWTWLREDLRLKQK